MKGDIDPENKVNATFVIKPYYVFPEDAIGDCAEVNCNTAECGIYSRCANCSCFTEKKENEN